MKKKILWLIGCIVGVIILVGNTDIVQAATHSSGKYTYSTDGTATKVESVAADDFLNFECVTTYASGREVKEKFSSFLQNSSSYYTIPGLRTTNVLGSVCDSMVPQSICEMESYIIVGAYDSDREVNSVMYVMSKSGTLLATVVMPNDTHMGAMAYDGTTLWVGDTINYRMISYTIAQIKDAVYYTSMLGAKSVEISIDSCNKIALKTKPSYATYYDGVLWVGKFLEKNNTQTPYIYGYKLIYSNGFFINAPAKYRIEAPVKTQGMTFYKRNSTIYLVISQSYGRDNDSKLIVYKPTNYDSPTYTNGYYQIYKGNRTKDITMPSMSQGICWNGVTMLMLFESGATVYSEKKHIFYNVADLITDCFCKLNISKVCVY